MPARTTTIQHKNGRSKKTAAHRAAPAAPTTTPTIQPWLKVENVEEACRFYQRLGFQQTMALPNSDGTWAWAVLRLGNGGIQLSALESSYASGDSRERQTQNGPRGLGCTFYVQVPAVEETYRLCQENGLEITSELRSEFWGDRVFSCVDAYGFEWMFGTPYKQMTPEEIINSAQNH